MIRHPVGILALLGAIEAGVIFLSENQSTRKFFKFLPAVFWIYFLPMVFSTIQLLPSQSVLYQNISTYFLPASLFLLFIGVDLPAIAKLGRSALAMMFAGTLGIVLGGPAVLFLYQKWLPPDAWSGIGALSASWVGGSANMVAIKEALGTADAIFVPMIAVDVVVAYSWMGILIVLANYQHVYDRWNRSKTAIIDELGERALSVKDLPKPKTNIGHIVLLLFMAAIATAVSLAGSKGLPEIKGFSSFTWAIVIVSILGISLSLTPLKKLQSVGSSKIGYLLLYFVLTSMGAKANLADLGQAPIFILLGFTWVLIHFGFLLVISRIIRAPLAIVATASQANIGGPVSAPIVASIYRPALAPVGLLLGVLGNVIGTYTALLCSRLCYLVAQQSFF